MLTRSNLISPLLVALAISAPSAGADQVLVAGTAGQVLRADAQTSVFQPFTCVCAGPITAMTADSKRLYVADSFGTVLTYDLDSGALLNTYTVPITPTAMSVYKSRLLVAGDQGTILLLDAKTGNFSDQRSVPTQINAMAVHGDDLYVAGLDGAVYTAKARGGPFSYFTCFCFTDIRSLVVVRDSLYVGDQFGLVGQVDINTGGIVNAFAVVPTFDAMAAQGGDLLVHVGSGLVKRVNRVSGTAEDYYFSPIPITAMLVIKEKRTHNVISPMPKPSTGLAF